jgi:predicted porin
MKRLNTIAAGAGATLLSLATQAQTSPSNVTIYGIADAFVQTARSHDSLSRLESGGLSGSRLGLRGTEDLGSGLAAIYTLEAGINMDDGTSGQGGALFGRQAFVGLKSDYGDLTLGRQYSSIYSATSDYSAFSNGNYGPSTAVIGGFAGGYEPVRGASGTATPPAAGATGNGGPARVNNSVRYESPSLYGVRAGALYGFGEVAGSNRDQRLVDLFARYEGGPVQAIASHVSDKTTGLTASDVSTSTVATAIALWDGHVFAGFMSVDDKSAADLDGRGYWLGGDYRFAHHLVRAQYLVNDPRNGSDNKTRAFGIGYQYDFSRRTSFYSSVTRFNNQSNAGGGLGRWNSAMPAGLTTIGDNDITEFVAGMRHIF